MNRDACALAIDTHRHLDWDNLRRVAVFRALNLGDMLCAVPALRALRRKLPSAHITLIGLESAVPVLQHFPGYVDELVIFPGDPAFPEKPVETAKLPGFYQDMQARDFDLIVQLHGSGPRSNEIVEAMAPRHWVGFVSSQAAATPGRLMPWPDHLHEIHRYLALFNYIGVEANDDDLGFASNAQDAQRAREMAVGAGLQPERTIILHVGARLPSRRWPAVRYAAVAETLLDEGWQVALTGSPGEADIVREVESALTDRVVNLCGNTELGVLAELLRMCRLLICNDTGISHVAACVGMRSVVIASGSDVKRWAPLNKDLHRVLYAPMACRPCAYHECPIGHPCALAIEVQDVLAEVHHQLHVGGG